MTIISDQAPSSDELRPVSRPARVLVVEDQPLIAMDLQYLVESFGFQVVGPVLSGQEAEDVLGRETIDAALIDFVLEDGDAGSLAARLHSDGVPFAVCSGADIAALRSVYPGTPVLAKPYSAEELSEILQDLLARGAHASNLSP